MGSLIPNSSRNLMPEDDGEVVSSSVRLLRQGRTMLPKPRFRFISVPEVAWDEDGMLLGSCASKLDAPDNSIILLSMGDGDDFISVPKGCTNIPNSPTGIPLDAGVISILNSVMTVVEEDIFSSNSWPYPLIPLVVEATRTRRRGVPVCTPVIVHGDGEEMISTLSKVLFSIGSDLRVGVIITRPIDRPEVSWSLFERVMSQVSGTMQIIEGKFVPAYGGTARR